MQLWKYRLDVDVCYNNTESIFTFWDRECTQILGISAADLRDKMIAVRTKYISSSDLWFIN
jgi:hypothetical protein